MPQKVFEKIQHKLFIKSPNKYSRNIRDLQLDREHLQ